MTAHLRFYLIMLALGLGWGLTIPMTKLAVSTGYSPIGLIAWQSIYLAALLSLIIALRGGRYPLRRRALGLFAVIALTGTLVPGAFSFRAAAELPAGVMAIVIALVPMFSLPIALGLGLERWQVLRALGLVLGALAVVLLIGPEASLPDKGAAVFVFVALVAPICYAVEGNYLAWRGTSGLDPVEVLWGSSVVATLIAVPVALETGTWINPLADWGIPETALLVVGLTNGLAYVGYIWLVGAAGPVFAAQVAYLVTAAGVLWSMALLGERYAVWVWLAFALMMIGLALVQPRGPAEGGALGPAPEDA